MLDVVIFAKKRVGNGELLRMYIYSRREIDLMPYSKLENEAVCFTRTKTSTLKFAHLQRSYKSVFDKMDKHLKT